MGSSSDPGGGGRDTRRARAPSRSARGLLVAGLIVWSTVGLVAGCGPSGSPAPTSVPTPALPSPSPSGSGGAPDDLDPEELLPEGPSQEPTVEVAPDLEAFLAQCLAGGDIWGQGRLDYPLRLDVELGDSAPYVVALDMNDVPAPPQAHVPGPSPTSVDVFARCAIAARLTPLGDGLDVGDQEWRTRTLTPSGVVTWTWAVGASTTNAGDVRLEIRPAVSVDAGAQLDAQLGGQVGGQDTEVLEYVTAVDVHTPLVRRAGDWWAASWDTIAMITVAAGAAVTGVIAWWRRNFRSKAASGPTRRHRAPPSS